MKMNDMFWNVRRNRGWAWKDQFVERIQKLHLKALDLESWYLAKKPDDADDEYACILRACRECVEILEECSNLASMMLAPRRNQKARTFEVQAKKALDELQDSLHESITFVYPMTQGTLVKRAGDLKILIINFIAL
jgi:hypothetical protein